MGGFRHVSCLSKSKKEQWKDIVKIFENSTHGADTKKPYLPGCHIDHIEELSDKKEHRIQLFGECRYSITGTFAHTEETSDTKQESLQSLVKKYPEIYIEAMSYEPGSAATERYIVEGNYMAYASSVYEDVSVDQIKDYKNLPEELRTMYTFEELEGQTVATVYPDWYAPCGMTVQPRFQQRRNKKNK